VQDRDGGPPLLKNTRKLFPFLTKVIADAACQGPRLATAATAIAAIADWQIESVKRTEAAGFHVLPKRWIVERTFTWLGRCRRLAKDLLRKPRPHRHRLPLARPHQALAPQTDKALFMNLNFPNGH
jgi:transposase